jgi:ribosomal protein S1
VGAVGPAVVTSRTEYGLFVDLDGHQALLHRTHLVPVPPVDADIHGGIDIGRVLRVEVIRAGDDLLGVAHRPYALPG